MGDCVRMLFDFDYAVCLAIILGSCNIWNKATQRYSLNCASAWCSWDKTHCLTDKR